MRDHQRRLRPRSPWDAALALALLSVFWTAAVAAQTAGSEALSFDDARTRLAEKSDARAGADANVAAKQDLAAATKHLRLPQVTLSVTEEYFRKTLEIPFGSLAPVAAEFGLETPLRFRVEKWSFRPGAIATLPLYTGGQISAAQTAAEAAIREAGAERDLTSDEDLIQLVRAYFGQQLAVRTLAVRRDVRDGLQQHLGNATALEREGFASKADRLQATVARDRAERQYRKASSDLDTAQARLANLLHSDHAVTTTTDLFVHTAPIAPVEEFQRAARSEHPQLERLRAITDQAKEGVRVQQAALKPQLLAFGGYDLYRKDATLEPDWVFGFNLKYTLFSRDGRLEKVSAARHQLEQAEAGLRSAERQLEIGVTSSYNDLEDARVQYVLLESAIAHAEESLRLQELSFREGLATSLDVIDARVALGQSRIDREGAAYEYDLRLALLLAASGQIDRYPEYVRRADRRLQ